MSSNVSTRYSSKPAKAESRVDLGVPTSEGKQRVLEIRTYKNALGLVTRASVMTVDGTFSSHILHEDFNRQVSAHKVAATERNVRAQHEGVLRNLDPILTSARLHYGAAVEQSAAASAAAA